MRKGSSNIYPDSKIIRLQWGRNMFVAESRAKRAGARHTLQLQWGRNMFVAERWPLPPQPSPRTCCFNGAATCSLRKAILRCEFVTVRSASMGPQHVRCGKLARSVGLERAPDHASMGPQHVRCGKFGLFSMPPPDRNCFNGAATCSLRKGSTAATLLWCRVASMGPQHVRCGKTA